jgi:hypothetical protein
MQSKPGTLDPRSRVAALARRQHGVVTRRQLLAIGLGGGATQHRLGSVR